ncbi:50S ribosome-binding GTPase [Pseudomonas sp. MH9.2]|uniref:GTPase n=1 Tax=unclassified Pseudomonas TaxID=196821 RepID=UPI002AC9DB9C|nr:MULTISPECIES: GTPase [unclassified Pseudomonas]MEB0027387.1 50S ribosome-binding GTPase [Pseudomonas sp. MH9.2]MEB0148713.1 50S ribosome-binding GTPase [Pseudomonas sp. CCC2.2]MEE3506611.1 50S ribosome-binding GTPase [Pseudomonas sp. 10C3]WPX68807.1 GTPase [Pseudomonas sp. MH9.2]
MRSDTATITDALEEAILNVIEGVGNINIIVAGKTGVGKSTLINCVFRGELAKTGSGKPVTQQIEEITKEGHPLTIIDSKGMELKDYQKISADLEFFIKKRSISGDENKHIHAAWLCIQESSNRVEDAEIELCNMLKKLSIPVIVVITQSMFGKENDFITKVKKDLNAATAFVQVRALAGEFEDDDGELYKFKEKNINALITETAGLIPEAKKRAFANALNSRHQSSMKIKIEQAGKEVLAASTLAAVAAASPIPFSDAILLVPIQVGMLAKVGVTFGMDVSTSALTTLVMSAVGSGAVTVVGRVLVTGLLKMIPGVGTVVGGVIAATTAAALTKALGARYIAVLTDFCEKNPGKDLDIALIGAELKRKMSFS